MRDGWQPPDDLPKFGDPANEDPRNIRIVELEAEIMDLEATLRAIVHQCEVADDPEHMTLGLVKNIAKAAIDNVMPPTD
jgi:Fe-S-cluster formation regulator IscX/YfhJ